MGCDGHDFEPSVVGQGHGGDIHAPAEPPAVADGNQVRGYHLVACLPFPGHARQQGLLLADRDAESVPGLSGPLKTALAGQTDPEKLFSVVEEDEEYIWAVPVTEYTQGDGKILGAIIVHLDRFPSSADLVAHTLILISRGLLIIVLAAGLIGGLFGSLTAEGMVSRLDRLWSVTTAWSRGDFSRFVHDPTGDEISQLAQRLNSMAVQVQELLASRQQMAVTEERNRLARDLHDSAKQQALAASFQIGTALTFLDQEDPTSARQHLIEAENLIDSVRLELTDLIHELRPPDKQKRRIDETIGDFAVEWAHQNQIHLSLDLDSVTLTTNVHEALYRVVQEALANVARHSRAETVNMLFQLDQGNTTLVIKDDGCGFQVESRHSGMGLASMRERVEQLGGDIQIKSEIGKGTVITVTLPVATPEEAV